MTDDMHDHATPAELRGRPRSSYARSHMHPDELEMPRAASERSYNAPSRSDATQTTRGQEKPAQSEKSFMAQVVTLARFRGWLTYHTYDSRKSAAGMPDLILVRGGRSGRAGRIIFAELKAGRGRVTREQRQWLDALATVSGAESYVWRPAQWAELDAILA